MSFIRNFFKSLIPRKYHIIIYNSLYRDWLSLMYGFIFSQLWFFRRVMPQLVYPQLISICVTTRCNLRCFICRREDFKGADFDFANLDKIKNAIRYAKVVDLTGWGECFLHPRLEDIINYIASVNRKKRIFHITTNGSVFSAKWGRILRGRIHKLTISLNAATAETYNRDMKGGSFDKTLRNIREFMAEIEPEDNVCLHFVAHSNNFREIPSFVQLASELNIRFVSIGNYITEISEHEAFTLLNVKDEYNRMVDEAQALSAKLGIDFQARRFNSETASNTDNSRCLDPYKTVFVQINGDLVPCCFCGGYVIGNAFDKGFEAIWFGPQYMKLRKRRFLPACSRCVPFVVFDDERAHMTEVYKKAETKG